MVLPVFFVRRIKKTALLLLSMLLLLPAGLTLAESPETPAKAESANSEEAAWDTTDPAIAEVRALARTGAARLALSVLAKQQPSATADPAGWMRWERERIRILRHSHAWQQITDRLATLPSGIPAPFRRWAVTQRAEALIKLGQGKAAIRLLQQLIWQIPADHPELDVWQKRWRRNVMDAYLVMGASEDARLASVHYFRDYGASTQADRLLHARILLSAERADEAADLLDAGSEDPQTATLSLLAQLRSRRQTPQWVLKTLLRRIRAADLDEVVRTQLWAVMAEAAKQVGDRATVANALEHVFASGESLPSGLFKVNPDSLWKAYLEFATMVGNEAQYLIGQDAPWFEAAARARKQFPVRARSLYAFLLIKGENSASRERAAEQIVASLKARKHGGRLLQALFLQSGRFPSKGAIPLVARYVLVDVALRQSDITLASSLMATIQAPPEGADQFLWQLRRARILVMGGDHQRGAAALQALLDTQTELGREQIDRFLQVVFDLQTVRAHAAAYKLFVAVMKRTDDQKLQRELYYWMAESLKAEGDYLGAARLYLKSAMLPDPEAMDPWAQTAHYQAADALAKAGLVRDARRLFSRLLAVTRDPGRRSVLQHELQKLWLVKGNGTKPQGEAKGH